MRLAVVLGACALVVATTAGSALAAPEIGRCGAQSGGKYTSASCNVKAKVGTGMFEFEKGAAGHLGFTATAGEAVLEGAGGVSFVCGAQTGTGVYKEVNGKINSVERVAWTFTGCGISGSFARCNTRGQPAGTFVYDELKGKLGYLAGEKTGSPTLGLQLEPSNQKAFAEIECEEGAVIIKIQSAAGHNCVISELTPADTMSTTISQVLETTGEGHQKWTHFEATPTKTCQLEASLNGGPREPVSQVLNATITSEISLMTHGI